MNRYGGASPTSTNPHVTRVEAGTLLHNTASQRVLAEVGVLEGPAGDVGQVHPPDDVAAERHDHDVTRAHRAVVARERAGA
jgi:hypothetical protein